MAKVLLPPRGLRVALVGQDHDSRLYELGAGHGCSVSERGGRGGDWKKKKKIVKSLAVIALIVNRGVPLIITIVYVFICSIYSSFGLLLN